MRGNLLSKGLCKICAAGKTTRAAQLRLWGNVIVIVDH